MDNRSRASNRCTHTRHVLFASGVVALLLAGCASPLLQEATPTQTPTVAPTPTETQTPTAAPPTMTPEPSPTPTPEISVDEAPDIAGLVRAVEDLAEEDLEGLGLEPGLYALYRAAAGNPYSLDQGVVAGIYLPREVSYPTRITAATTTTKGLVGLRCQVIETLLRQAGYPGTILFPLPLDITYGQPEDEVIIFVGSYGLKTHLPTGSKLVAAMPHDLPDSLHFLLPQGSFGTSVDPEQYGHTFTVADVPYDFALLVPRGSLPTEITEPENVAVTLGDTILDISLPRGFPISYLEWVNSNTPLPPVLQQMGTRLNFIIHAFTLSQEEDMIVGTQFTTSNLLQAQGDDSVIFSLANSNPLLQ